MRHCYILMLVITIACSNQGNKELLPYRWTKILDSGPWKKSYNFQLFSLKDSCLVFHPDGVWISKEGRNWSKTTLPNAISNLAFLDYLPLKDGVLGLGHFEGNIEQFSFQPVIYQTKDLRNWQVLSEQSNLPQRFFYHPFVFQDKIWIIGGEDKNRQYADIWNSPDGVIWTRVLDAAPFGPRSSSRVVELQGRLYLLNNDAWTSTDGLHWTRLAVEILPGQQLFGYEALVFDQKIWLIGCNRNGLFSSQVLFSADGKNWQEMAAPWSPRGGVAATMHHQKVFMTGGKYGGTPDAPDFRYSNDLWTLEKMP